MTDVPPLKVVNDAFRTMNVLNASFTTLTHHLAKPWRRNDIHSDHVYPIRPVRIYSRISPYPGRSPVAAGRSGSRDQWDHDPAYSGAGSGRPATSRASTTDDAVTPEPQ